MSCKNKRGSPMKQETKWECPSWHKIHGSLTAKSFKYAQWFEKFSENGFVLPNFRTTWKYKSDAFIWHKGCWRKKFTRFASSFSGNKYCGNNAGWRSVRWKWNVRNQSEFVKRNRKRTYCFRFQTTLPKAKNEYWGAINHFTAYLILEFVKKSENKFLAAISKDHRRCFSLTKINPRHFNPSLRVTQGSILGPLFFLIYINDLPSVVFSSVALLFADDLKLIYSGSPEQLERLQSDIDNLLSWSTQNCLLFYAKKCSVIEFVPGKNKRKTNVALVLGNEIMKQTSRERPKSAPYLRLKIYIKGGPSGFVKFQLVAKNFKKIEGGTLWRHEKISQKKN